MEDTNLQAWLIRMSQGDEEAFQLFYESTRDHAFRLIYYLAPNKQEVGDMMSEVYMQLLKSLDNYDHKQNFNSWFNGLIVRQVRNWKRRSWRRIRILDKIISIDSSMFNMVTEDRTKTVHDRLDVIPVVETLSQKHKEVIVLKYYKQYSNEEISELLHIPIGTVKSRHHLAIKQMRRQFDSQTEDKGRTKYVY